MAVRCQLRHDGQPQAGAAGGGVARCLDAVERLQHLVHFLGGNARPPVLHQDGGAPVLQREQDFRRACIESLTRSEALDFMIDTVKAVAEQTGRLAQTQTDRE